VLVAGIAYAIFKGSTQAFRGFLFGVCVPVGGPACGSNLEGYMHSAVATEAGRALRSVKTAMEQLRLHTISEPHFWRCRPGLAERAGIHPKHAAAPGRDVKCSWFLCCSRLLPRSVRFAAVGGGYIRARFFVRHVMEGIFEGFGRQYLFGKEIIGHHYHLLYTLLGDAGPFFHPDLQSAWSDSGWSRRQVCRCSSGMRLVTWFTITSQGFREQVRPTSSIFYGAGLVACAPHMFPIEIFSHLGAHLSRPSVICEHVPGEMVTLVFFSLIPLGVPIIFRGCTSELLSFRPTFLYADVCLLAEATARS